MAHNLILVPKKYGKAANTLGYRPAILALLSAIALIDVYFAPMLGALIAASIAVYTLLTLSAQVRQAFKPNREFVGSGPGVLQTSRLALLIVATAILGTESWHVLVAIGLLVVAIVLETPVKNATPHILPVAANLPGLTFRNRLVLHPVWAPLTSLLATISVLFVDFLDLLWPLVWLLIASNFVVVLICLVDAGVQVLARRGVSEKIYQALSDYEPSFVLHWKAPAKTTYQVAMWEPTLEATEEKYFYLVRTVENYRELAASTSRPVVLRRRLEQLDETVVPSLKAALYVNTATFNNHYVRYTQLTHIQLNHGDSDKAPSFNPSFRIFDKNFVAGQAAVDRFAANGVPTHEGFFEIVGRPQVDNVIALSSPQHVPSTQKTVLYAPTWHGFYADTNYSSLPHGLNMVQEMANAGIAVIFRPHPYSFRDSKYAAMAREIVAFLGQDRDKTGLPHVFGAEATEPPISALFNKSDAMVSDISSVVSDYLYSEKPFAMVSMKSLEILRTEAPLSECSYVVDGSESYAMTGFAAVLQAMFTDDPKREMRLQKKRYYLGDIPAGQQTLHFTQTLKKYL